MAENLNYEADGKCYKDRNYPDEAVNCEEHGRLYFWKAAKTVCPKGWRLPTSEEWKSLKQKTALPLCLVGVFI
jgi:uncharacterized protein (TIGR02145 family)